MKIIFHHVSIIVLGDFLWGKFYIHCYILGKKILWTGLDRKIVFCEGIGCTSERALPTSSTRATILISIIFKKKKKL